MRFLEKILQRLTQLPADMEGGTALIFGLTLPALILVAGGGFDLTTAMSHRQKIASALEVACVQSALEINHKISQGAKTSTDFGPGTVVPIANQRIKDAGIKSGVTVTATTKPSNIELTGDSSSPALFAQIGGLKSLKVKVKRECLYGQASQKPPAGQVQFVESFEQGHAVAKNSWTVLGPNGNKANGASWNGWNTHNAGVEINGLPELSGGVIRFGNFFAELDSHCYVAGCNSNSAMSRKLTLQPGNYQLSYWYISRIKNSSPSWKDVVACGAKETDPAVAPYRSWQNETNRVEVFVEKVDGSKPAQFPAGGLVDLCVYSGEWTERTVDLAVLDAGDYWVSWRAAGQQDTTGGLIDYLRFCKGSCP